jgi:Family of unknown function (DUF6481)
LQISLYANIRRIGVARRSKSTDYKLEKKIERAKNVPPDQGRHGDPSFAFPLDERRRRNLLLSLQPRHDLQEDRTSMGFKEPNFFDRQAAARNARKDILEKFKAKPGPDDPEVLKRAAERQELAAKREEARLAREAAKAEQKAREEEQAAQVAAEAARLKAEKEAAEAEREAEQKAARDARYAARKARKK